jgi:ribonuclease D
MDDLFIDTPEQLDALCTQLRGQAWLAVDTEFIRERTYRAQLCLVQVATAEVVACIDTLALDDLGPLVGLLLDPATVKVLHAARQDLEIFHDLAGGQVPMPVFDTQLAATLAGFGDQVGYADLVRKLLGVQLDKSQARTDWSARPLDPEQLSYAADDVRHLGTAYLRLLEHLDRTGRSDWLATDFERLGDPAQYRSDPESAWRRLRGANQLRGRQLAVLQALAAWRERRAAESDKPRRWILDDATLLALARSAPTRRDQLAKVRGIGDGLVRRHGGDLLQLIRTAREVSPPAAVIARPVRLGAAEEACVDALMALLRLLADRHGVALATLATRRDLENLVRGERDLPLLQGWRHGLAGEALDRFLAGDGLLACRDGELAWEHPAED